MKKILTTALALFCATTIMVQAQDASTKKEKHKLTTEQQQVMDSMLAKYDTNKDGKLDKTERAAMTQEDKDKMAQVGLNQGKKKKASTSAADGDTNKDTQTSVGNNSK
jgi:Ni/Co efflux regulator RcnB